MKSLLATFKMDHAIFVLTRGDSSLLHKEFLVLVARVLMQYVPCLQIFQDLVLQHIPTSFHMT